ncbi:plasmid recombination protein, partial [Staphylococcus saprophyticus]|uniref:plasmid recombination protein n=1 Tax=Staphylococcus saprophyticus TaxID=29385 RepID=UPI00177FAE77
MEEKRGDMDYGVVGIRDDGGLSGKDVVGNKKGLREFEDRFNEYLNDKGDNLEGGEWKDKREGKDKEVERYKSEREYDGK